MDRDGWTEQMDRIIDCIGRQITMDRQMMNGLIWSQIKSYNGYNDGWMERGGWIDKMMN